MMDSDLVQYCHSQRNAMDSPSAFTAIAEITFWHLLILVYPCHPLDTSYRFPNIKWSNRPKWAAVVYALGHCTLLNRSLSTNFPMISSVCECLSPFMNVYYTFLSCLIVSTITRILKFFKSIFSVWNSPLTFSIVFLCSFLLCHKKMRTIFSNKVKLILVSIQNAAQWWYCSVCLGFRNPKELPWARSQFCLPPHFPNEYFFCKKKKKKKVWCSLALLTTIFTPRTSLLNGATQFMGLGNRVIYSKYYILESQI